MRKAISLVAGAVALIVAAALPASAADTTATVTLTGGALTVTAPAGPVPLGTAAVTAATVGGALGTVTVTDDRGVDPAAWTATVNSTDFVSGAHTITVANAAYDPGVLTTTGDPTFTGIPLAALSAAPTDTVTAVTGTGVNTASWDPTISVTLPPTGAVAGAYTATITHSVA